MPITLDMERENFLNSTIQESMLKRTDAKVAVLGGGQNMLMSREGPQWRQR